ncbi:hypothetical protein QJQ45_025042, partial [Haematococcus lacustris]
LNQFRNVPAAWPDCFGRLDRHAGLQVALQDHHARTIRIPGGPKTAPSIEPVRSVQGAEMTLAQHLGLVARPPPLLTTDEWDKVQLQARLRQDSNSECPICREGFKAESQVLLSCSHVFHKSCLASFERYARVRCCPLCRAAQYQKRLIQDGAERYRTACATRIQAAVRGHLARKRYRELRKHHAPADPRLRRQWAAERLGESSSSLIQGLDSARGDLDALFAEMDAALALSRAVGDSLASSTAKRLQEQLQVQEALDSSLQDMGPDPYPHGRPPPPTHLPPPPPSSGPTPQTPPAPQPQPPLTPLAASMQHSRPPGSGAAGRDAAGVGSSSGSEPRQGAPGGGVDWGRVQALARKRGEEECPICIGALARSSSA